MDNTDKGQTDNGQWKLRTTDTGHNGQVQGPRTRSYVARHLEMFGLLKFLPFGGQTIPKYFWSN